MAVEDPDHQGLERDDLAMWRAIAADGRLSRYEPGEILRIFWKARCLPDGPLESELACHLSDEVVRRLEKKVKSSFPDGGRDLIDEVHFKMMEALLDTESADGRALAEHFEARLHYRFLDAVKRQRRRQQVELPPLVDDDGSQEDGNDPSAIAGFDSVEVGHALSLVRDERKRLAFVMTMTDQPKHETARALGIDPSTLLRWTKEVRAFLKTELNL